MSELIRVDVGDAESALSPGESLAARVRSKNIADTLVKHYPGYLWAVQPYQDGTAYQVYCLNLSGKWGFVIHESKIDNDYKVVVNAGGEILERYRVSRERLHEDNFKSDVKTLFDGSKAFDE